ncbi:MAG: FliI/YscN family ATPase [Candidatus Marinimicrobia bacterium]|nr:FliI/YscN family ATPase [Candidatus Neomarinimicrobiota bacterium]
MTLKEHAGPDLNRYLEQLAVLDTHRLDGRVTEVVGLVVEATVPNGAVGDLCTIDIEGGEPVRAEVMGFRNGKMLLMPLDNTMGVSVGSRVTLNTKPLTVPVGHQLLGRIIDSMGRPIDGKGPINTATQRSVYNLPLNPMSRKRITEPFSTGIRSIDGLLTMGRGQRVGIFSGSGVGKSVLIGMIARHTDADINVIGLIGERGREVREFIERDLGEEALKRSVVVVATSDQAAQLRVKAALVTVSVAEYFRDQGHEIMLMMDSLTRVAMAQREIGLAIGEPPTTKGYTPSVFALLPRMLERTGAGRDHSITALFTVLVESDDLNDPIADAARSLLDGHIVLSRDMANRGHYPAIDPLQSVSRLRRDMTTPEQVGHVEKVIELLSVYRDSEDLINIGAYSPGSNSRIDAAIAGIEYINAYLKQDGNLHSGFEQSQQELAALCQVLEAGTNGG